MPAFPALGESDEMSSLVDAARKRSAFKLSPLFALR